MTTCAQHEAELMEAARRIADLEAALRAFRAIHRKCVVSGTGLDLRCSCCQAADDALRAPGTR